MSIHQSIQQYQAKTGETFLHSPDLALKVIGDFFMLWKLGISDGIPFFFVNQCYAKSFSVFAPFIREVCQVAGIETLATSTCRNPAPYIRKWKMTRVPEQDYEYEGRQYVVLKTHISNLK